MIKVFEICKEVKSFSCFTVMAGNRSTHERILPFLLETHCFGGGWVGECQSPIVILLI